MGDVGRFGELEYKVVSNHAGRSYGKQENGSRGVREERKLRSLAVECGTERSGEKEASL